MTVTLQNQIQLKIHDIPQPCTKTTKKNSKSADMKVSNRGRPSLKPDELKNAVSLQTNSSDTNPINTETNLEHHPNNISSVNASASNMKNVKSDCKSKVAKASVPSSNVAICKNSANIPGGSQNSANVPCGSQNSANVPGGSQNSANVPGGSQNSANVPGGSQNSANVPGGNRRKSCRVMKRSAAPPMPNLPDKVEDCGVRTRSKTNSKPLANPLEPASEKPSASKDSAGSDIFDSKTFTNSSAKLLLGDKSENRPTKAQSAMKASLQADTQDSSNGVRGSRSTPSYKKRNSHVRALDFRTPTKSSNEEGTASKNSSSRNLFAPHLVPFLATEEKKLSLNKKSPSKRKLDVILEESLNEDQCSISGDSSKKRKIDVKDDAVGSCLLNNNVVAEKLPSDTFTVPTIPNSSDISQFYTTDFFKTPVKLPDFATESGSNNLCSGTQEKSLGTASKNDLNTPVPHIGPTSPVKTPYGKKADPRMYDDSAVNEGENETLSMNNSCVNNVGLNLYDEASLSVTSSSKTCSSSAKKKSKLSPREMGIVIEKKLECVEKLSTVTLVSGDSDQSASVPISMSNVNISIGGNSNSPQVNLEQIVDSLEDTTVEMETTPSNCRKSSSSKKKKNKRRTDSQKASKKKSKKDGKTESSKKHEYDFKKDSSMPDLNSSTMSLPDIEVSSAESVPSLLSGRERTPLKDPNLKSPFRSPSNFLTPPSVKLCLSRSTSASPSTENLFGSDIEWADEESRPLPCLTLKDQKVTENSSEVLLKSVSSGDSNLTSKSPRKKRKHKVSNSQDFAAGSCKESIEEKPECIKQNEIFLSKDSPPLHYSSGIAHHQDPTSAPFNEASKVAYSFYGLLYISISCNKSNWM